MTAWTAVPATSLTVVPWRNGHGTSRDIATHRDPAGALLWQVSIADLVHGAPFSHYPDCDRIFTPIEGDPPPELAFHGGPFEPCPLLVPKAFSGDWPTLSRIPAPGRAFNAVVDRRHHTAAVRVVHLAPGDAVPLPDALTIVLHCLTGRLVAPGLQVGPGDSLVGSDLSFTAPGPTLTASEPAIALVVAIRPAGDQTAV